MEKHIMGENGISYSLGEDGLYYPDLYLPEETRYPIGKYGMMRRTYLKEHRKSLYLELVLSGKLNEHLYQIDEECHQMMDRLVGTDERAAESDRRIENAGSDGMG